MERNELSAALDRHLATPMFVVASLYLTLTAALLYLNQDPQMWWVLRACLIGMLIVYPVFPLECLAHWLCGGRQLKQHLWHCLVPPLRIVVRDHGDGTTVWVPGMGWRTADRDLEKQLTRAFSIPMIVIALFVLPVIGMEFFWLDDIEKNRGWKLGIQVAVAFIWAAFTFEFVVLVSVVKRPWTYARRHWLDLAIILLPMIWFARAMRLTQLMRVNQLAQTARMYRLRGLAIRIWRGFVALEVIDMLLSRNPERRLEKLVEELEEKQHELAILRQEITRCQRRVAERAEKLEKKKKESRKSQNAAKDESGGDQANSVPSNKADTEKR